MQTLTASKAIVFDRETRDYAAMWEGQTIGFFPSYLAAETALNDYVLLLCEQGLVDRPLALLAEQAASSEPADDDDEEDISIQYEDVPYPFGIGNPDPAPEPPPGSWPDPRPYPALTRAARTFAPIPPPVHDGELLEQLCDEASLARAQINLMLHRAVRERARQRGLVAIYETVPAEALCDRLYRLHGKACDRSIRRRRAYTAWLDDHTCPGVEHPRGASALNAYAARTGFDLETARGVTLWYCDKHYREMNYIFKREEVAAD
jgi:hypothetical protein